MEVVSAAVMAEVMVVAMVVGNKLVLDRKKGILFYV
jgi:hypothetical protein